ncbi:polysaccharide pyruvyl transferase family protein [Roseisalinus antarcticus]|uniref:Polysaccharide pyruvyl transferase n=1 Tax=Roseisalinus antarcticus TaxID=254357 RepID=A0A1Y5TPL1_9RHOB|nr:polysaccharide pyruvyl transferase family protein [Roseisalinus antarcticus]SLN68959.1 Polysaccharide pyruvyl transferase [Roseisalinus antarcticus]
MAKTTALVHFNHKMVDGKVAWNDLGTTDFRPNYGDMLVCAALLQHLGPAAAEAGETRMMFGQPARPADVALVRGSTYVHKNFDYRKAMKTLEGFDCPIAIIGLGAQSQQNDPTFLDDNADARDFVACLNERSKSISVRGAFTAEVLTRLGAQNIRVTGCPSLFYSCAVPSVTLPGLLDTPERRLGVSLHTGLRGSIYCRDPAKAREKHVQALVHAIEGSSKAGFFEQGVKLEFDLADHRLPFEARMAAAREVLAHIGGEGALSPEQVIAHTVSVRSIDDWLSKVRDVDAMVGFRFHGNMVGLLQGLPCYYWTYDSRLKEFCELYKLPYSDVAEEWVDPVRAMLDHDWDAANAAFATCHAELKACYAENGIETVL